MAGSVNENAERYNAIVKRILLSIVPSKLPREERRSLRGSESSKGREEELDFGQKKDVLLARGISPNYVNILEERGRLWSLVHGFPRTRFFVADPLSGTDGWKNFLRQSLLSRDFQRLVLVLHRSDLSKPLTVLCVDVFRDVQARHRFDFSKDKPMASLSDKWRTLLNENGIESSVWGTGWKSEYALLNHLSREIDCYDTNRWHKPPSWWDPVKSLYLGVELDITTAWSEAQPNLFRYPGSITPERLAVIFRSLTLEKGNVSENRDAIDVIEDIGERNDPPPPPHPPWQIVEESDDQSLSENGEE